MTNVGTPISPAVSAKVDKTLTTPVGGPISDDIKEVKSVKTKDANQDSFELSTSQLVKNLSKPTEQEMQDRMKMLEQLKKEVQSGTYKIDFENLAQKMLNEAVKGLR